MSYLIVQNDHSSASPNLNIAPSDFHSLRSVDCRIGSIIDSFQNMLFFYRLGIEKLSNQCQEVIDNYGEYIID